MGRLVYSAIASLDGYVEDADGGFGWAVPDAELHQAVNDAERGIGTYLYGRRMYEVMRYWQTGGTEPDDAPQEHDYARLWRAADKVVFSRILQTVDTPRTRLERAFDPDVVRALKRDADGVLSIGGADLAAQAFAHGLVDEVTLYLHPLTVGAGKAALPGGVGLELIATSRYGSGVVGMRYAVTG